MFWLHMANIPEEEGGVHWEDWPVIFLSRIIPVFFFWYQGYTSFIKFVGDIISYSIFREVWIILSHLFLEYL